MIMLVLVCGDSRFWLFRIVAVEDLAVSECDRNDILAHEISRHKC